KVRPEFRDMEAALDILDKGLTVKSAPSRVLQEMVKNDREKARFLAVLCLGSLDYLSELLDALEDPQHPDVREAAVIALRHWLGRKAGQDRLLGAALRQKGYSEVKSDVVLHLLRSPDPEDLARRETYALLIEHLGSDKAGIRQLASWHLQRLVPPKM